MGKIRPNYGGNSMDVNRAKEIVESPKMIEVQLNGNIVWIDSVDATTKTATVHKEDAAETTSMTVRVDELQEIGVIETRL
jgi:small acid-soluble spore protein H (minor)